MMKIIWLMLGIMLLVRVGWAQSAITVWLKSQLKEPTYLEYIDIFNNNQLTILSNTNQQAKWSVENPVFLRDADHRSQASYLLFPTKSYTLTRGTNYYLTAHTAADSSEALANCHQHYLNAEKLRNQGEWSFEREYLVGVSYTKLTFEQRSQELRKRYQSRLLFLNKYAQQHHLNNRQITPWKDYFFYQYIRGLLAHTATQIPPDSIKQYVRFFQDDTKLSIPEYRYGAIGLLRKLVNQPTGKIDFAQMYQKATHSFSAGTCDFLLFYIMKTLSQPKEDRLPNVDFNLSLARQLLPAFQADCQQEAYVNYVTKSIGFLTTMRSSVGKEVKLLDGSGSSITWAQLLAGHRGRIVYVDFWASWCAPCRAELPASHQLRSSLRKANISFLYISMDEDSQAWLNAGKQVGLEKQFSYLLTHSFQSALANQYQLTAIPRYLLFDQQGKLISARAKRPSDKTLQAELHRLVR